MADRWSALHALQDELLHMNLGYNNLVNLSLALRNEFPPPAILYGDFEGSWITDDKLFPQ
eukprot:SAG31_NODE_32183_length_359_cov_0.596154_1_plen_59_part_10